jgi:hypothetical protein
MAIQIIEGGMENKYLRSDESTSRTSILIAFLALPFTE